MANECLVTKLKGIVDNDNLLKIGESRIDMVLSPGSIMFDSRTHCYVLASDGTTVVDLPNGGWTPNLTKYPERDTYIVGGKYAIKNFNANTVYINSGEEFAFSQLEQFGAGIIVPESVIFTFPATLKGFNAGAKNSSYHNNIFANCVNLEYVALNNFNNAHPITYFNNCIKLTDLSIIATIITGGIEELANGQVANGRVSGALVVTSNGIITYNGTAVASNVSKTIKFGTSMTNPTQEDTERGWQIADN
jgi:hypothetical protein